MMLTFFDKSLFFFFFFIGYGFPFCIFLSFFLLEVGFVSKYAQSIIMIRQLTESRDQHKDASWNLDSLIGEPTNLVCQSKPP